MGEKAIVQIDEEGTLVKCYEGSEECGYKSAAPVCGKCGAMAEKVDPATLEEKTEEVEGVAEEESVADDAETKDADETEEVEEVEEVEVKEDAVDEAKVKMAEARELRIKTLGFDAEKWGDDAYICGYEGQMKAANAEPCPTCPGGCAPEGDLPTLLQIQGIAQSEFDGKILDSGYSPAADLFVVDVERKDGRVIEAFYDGTEGFQRGWQMLDESLIGEKAEVTYEEVIGYDAAKEIAVKAVEGDVVSVSADTFEGWDAYAVEIEAPGESKSYDVFVSLDGTLLGIDEYTVEAKADQIDELEDEPADEKTVEVEEAAEEAVEADEKAEEVEESDESTETEGDEPEAEEKTGHMMDDEEEYDEDGKPKNMDKKREYSQEQRMEMAKRGEALADGSYPIKDEEDLKNAIMAYGRAKNQEETKRHIVKRARALGKTDLLPDNWEMGKDDEEETSTKVTMDEDPSFFTNLAELESLLLEDED